jgi:pimeloyl-ACP methyl ester carboxylesterase
MTMRLMQSSRDSNLEERISQIQMPVLILHGTLDKMAPPHVGQAYTAAIPNSHLMLVYDAAHECDAERPEAVSELIDDFFSRQGGFLVNTKSGLINA